MPRGVSEAFLAQHGRFIHLASGTACELPGQEAREFGSLGIPQPGPDEMENLVNQKKAKLPGVCEKTRVEHDFAPADEAGGIDGGAVARGARDQLAPVRGQIRAKRKENRAAGERGQAGQQRPEIIDATAMVVPEYQAEELRRSPPDGRATECFRCGRNSDP